MKRIIEELNNGIYAVLNGPYAILTTLFKENGVVDMDALLFNTEELCKSNITGIVPCGSTGEFTSNDFSENKAILKEAAKAVNGRKQLIDGATSANTFNTLRYMDCIGELGYAAALVAPPFYFIHGDEEVAAFYQEIGKAEIPVVSYNIPVFPSPVSISVYQRLLHRHYKICLKYEFDYKKEERKWISETIECLKSLCQCSNISPLGLTELRLQTSA